MYQLTKHIFCLVFLSCLTLSVSSQNWEYLGTKGLGGGSGRCMTVYQGNLIIGGVFTNAADSTGNGTIGDLNNIVSWDGTKFHKMAGGTGTAGVYGIGFPQVNDMVVYRDTLYIGGAFTIAGSVSAKNIAKWDGKNYYAFADIEGVIHDLHVDGDNLYVGGLFNMVNGDTMQNVAMYDGTQWHKFDTILSGEVKSVVVFKDSLIVGGQFQIPEDGKTTTAGAAIYKGDHWEELTKNDQDTSLITGKVEDMRILGDSLILVGNLSHYPNIAMYKGEGRYEVIGALFKGFFGSVSTVESYNGFLVAGGEFDEVGDFNGNRNADNVAAYLNGTWTQIGDGLPEEVRDLLGYKGELYAVGTFNEPAASGAKKWRGTLTSYVGPVIKEKEIVLYPNPSNGGFRFAGFDSGVLNIYDSSGKLVEVHKVNSNILISTNLKQGMYYYQLLNDKILVGTGKIIMSN